MLSQARIQANKKYLGKAGHIIVRVKKGRRLKMKAYAESLGMSLNAYINNLIDKDMGP
jgi:hypothetical protein